MDGKRALLFANGVLEAVGAIRAYLRPDDYLVAVDGGLGHLDCLGRQPNILIGDLDSVDPARVLALENAGVEIKKYPVDKDETDLELALQFVAQQGFKTIRVVGALGGRIDQMLGNLYLLSLESLTGCDVRLEDGMTEVALVKGKIVIDGQPGDIISLLPLGVSVVGVTTTDLKYPLHAETLFPDHSRGISNVMLKSRCRIKIEEGKLLCIHMRSQSVSSL
jgi:thiamine pyrophosphokinase